MAIDIEMIVVSALLAVVFLPFGLWISPIAGFVLFVLKVLFIVAIMALFRTIFARMRIDQMVTFCWKYLAPAAMVQIVINLFLKGILFK
jgi:NADH-quinone oxidoreductase subunit H